MGEGLYLWLKAAHVASVLIFAGGLVVTLLALAVIGRKGLGDEAATARIQGLALRWDRSVTVPALTLAWIFGFWIAFESDVLTDGWFIAKMVFVIILSGLHGMFAGRLRRMDPAEPEGHVAPPLVLAGLVLVSFAAIAALAVTKPF